METEVNTLYKQTVSVFMCAYVVSLRVCSRVCLSVCVCVGSVYVLMMYCLVYTAFGDKSIELILFSQTSISSAVYATSM